MTETRGTKGVRADRRLSKVCAHYQGLLQSSDEKIQLEAANRLGDILMRQAELRDRADEREFKRELRAMAVTPTAPAPAPVPAVPQESIDQTIAKLRLEVAEREKGKQALATGEEKSWFDWQA
jgi:hypothetical protein